MSLPICRSAWWGPYSPVRSVYDDIAALDTGEEIASVDRSLCVTGFPGFGNYPAMFHDVRLEDAFLTLCVVKT